MSTPDPLSRSRRAGAVGAGIVTDVALIIAGLGMTSLLLDEPVIATPGLGQAPGVIAVTASVVVFAAVLWGALGRARVIGTVVVSALTAFLSYVLALAIGVATSALHSGSPVEPRPRGQARSSPSPLRSRLRLPSRSRPVRGRRRDGPGSVTTTTCDEVGCGDAQHPDPCGCSA